MDRVAAMKLMQFLALWALGYALTFGASVALAVETWSAGSGSFSSSEASGARSYTYQNAGGVQSWQHDTPGGHSTTTYRPAGTPGHGNYVFDNTGTGATARTNVHVPYAPGKYGTAGVTNAMSKAGIAAAGAALARLAGPVALAATAYSVYEALTDNGYESLAGDPDTWAKSEADNWLGPVPTAKPYVSPTPDGGKYYGGNICEGLQVCDLVTCSGGGYPCVNVWDDKTHPTIYSGAQQNPNPAMYVFYEQRRVYSGTSCPSGMTYSSSPAGCYSDGGQRAATPAELAAMEAAIIDGCPGGCGFGPMVPAILENGGTIPADAFGPTLITIPDSGIWPGDTQTTTHPDGSQTVTESSYDATGNGDTVEVRKTTTVTEKDSTGTTTSVTTTEGSATSEAPPAEVTPLCEQFPNILACATQDEAAPAVVSLNEDVRDVGLLTPETVSGGEGSCPAPIEVSAVGQTLSFSYQPVCDLATGIRPVVLILGWLAAGMLLFGGVKGGGD